MLEERLDVGPSGISDRLRGNDAALLELAREAELAGIAPLGTGLDQFARSVGVDHDPLSWTRRVDARLWNALREASNLADGSTPTFRSPVDVVLAAAALIGSHPHLTDRRKPQTRLPDDDLAAAHVLTEALCRVSSGPYGSSADATEALAVLAPVTYTTAFEFIRSSPVGSSAIRAIDTAMRISATREVRDPDQRSPTTLGSRFTLAAQHLIANPPVLLFRNALWMRAVRRVMWLDRRAGHPTKTWALEQARRGMHGADAYAWSGAVERRYALWVLAEFTPADDVAGWDALHDEALAYGTRFADDLDEAREELATDWNGRPPDLFNFRPEAGWSPPDSIADTFRDRVLLDPERHRDRGRGRRPPIFGLKHLQSSWFASQLVAEALLAPCTIRHRTAIGTLKVCSATLREQVSEIVSELLTDCTAGDGALEQDLIPLVERCVHLLGGLHCDSAIPIVNALLRRPALPASVAKVAILTAGDLGRRYPDHAEELLVWSFRLAEKQQSDPCVAAAVHACVEVGGADAAEHLDRLARLVGTTGQERTAMFRWAADTLEDPLLGTRPR